MMLLLLLRSLEVKHYLRALLCEREKILTHHRNETIVPIIHFIANNLIILCIQKELYKPKLGLQSSS